MYIINVIIAGSNLVCYNWNSSYLYQVYIYICACCSHHLSPPYIFTRADKVSRSGCAGYCSSLASLGEGGGWGRGGVLEFKMQLLDFAVSS